MRSPTHCTNALAHCTNALTYFGNVSIQHTNTSTHCADTLTHCINTLANCANHLTYFANVFNHCPTASINNLANYANTKAQCANVLTTVPIPQCNFIYASPHSLQEEIAILLLFDWYRISRRVILNNWLTCFVKHKLLLTKYLSERSLPQPSVPWPLSWRTKVNLTDKSFSESANFLLLWFAQLFTFSTVRVLNRWNIQLTSSCRQQVGNGAVSR